MIRVDDLPGIWKHLELAVSKGIISEAEARRLWVHYTDRAE